jgi:hypothetical protein
LAVIGALFLTLGRDENDGGTPSADRTPTATATPERTETATPSRTTRRPRSRRTRRRPSRPRRDHRADQTATPTRRPSGDASGNPSQLQAKGHTRACSRRRPGRARQLKAAVDQCGGSGQVDPCGTRCTTTGALRAGRAPR